MNDIVKSVHALILSRLSQEQRAAYGATSRDERALAEASTVQLEQKCAALTSPSAGKPMVFSRIPAWIALAACVTASSAPAQQTYPDRNVTIVAPAAPGGLYTIFARLIGNKLEQSLGKPFVIVNRPGASSPIRKLPIVHAATNGYRLMVANNTGMATNVSLFKNLSYDPIADLAPIALIARIPEVLVVNSALPVPSLADLVKLAKSTRGGLNFGSAGTGTPQHLSGEFLKGQLGIEMTHVPYNGLALAMNDVASGHTQLMFAPVPTATAMIQAGKVRPLGVTSTRRLDALPDVPPLAEVGVKDFDSTTAWFMLVAPAKTPKAIIDKLHAELRSITEDPATRQEFIRLGLIPVSSPSPDELKSFMQSEIVRWGDLVRKAGLAGSE